VTGKVKFNFGDILFGVCKTYDELVLEYGEDRAFRSVEDFIETSTREARDRGCYLALIDDVLDAELNFSAYGDGDPDSDTAPLVIRGYTSPAGDGGIDG